MNDLRNLGEELRQRREELGFSRDDVHANARIPLASLAALEDGEVSRLPAACYVVGFLKSYCALLELEPSRFVEAYKAALEEPVQQRGVLGLTQRPQSGGEPPSGWMTEAVVWAAICGILVLGWIAYASVVRPTDDPGQGRVEAETLRELVVPPTPPTDP